MKINSFGCLAHIHIADPKVVQGIQAAKRGRPGVELEGHFRICLGAQPPGVHDPESVEGQRMALVGCRPQEGEGDAVILRDAVTASVHRPEFGQRLRVAAAGRLSQQRQQHVIILGGIRVVGRRDLPGQRCYHNVC